MEVKSLQTHHLVKSEDLNHHGTLYAGRSAEWFVESGFIAAASLTRPDRLVCLRIHGMQFSHPVRSGQTLCFESKVVLAGRSSLISYVRALLGEDQVVEGFITFVYVDQGGKSQPHGIEITTTNPEDIALQQRASQLGK